MQTVAETPHYEHRAAKLLSAEEQDAVIIMIADNPLVGDVIVGTGGVRKVRYSRGSRGKSGGVRVVYYYYDETVPVYLLEVFGKNEKTDLTKAERNNLAKLTTILKRSFRETRQ